MASSIEPRYEEQFTVYIDLLGFSEATGAADDATRLKVLNFLHSLSSLRGEFDMQSTEEENRRTNQIRPAISTFSDHVVISYPLQHVYSELGSSEQIAARFLTSQFLHLLARIAAAALRIGFLLRGGATIGRLYHADGVVFGEALMDAYRIESQASIYPRVVVSQRITDRPEWIEIQHGIRKGDDGLYHLDYFHELLLDAAQPGEKWAGSAKEWFREVAAVIADNLTELEKAGRLKELAKWTWFAREFRGGLERLPRQLLSDLGLSPDVISLSNPAPKRTESHP